VTGEPPPDFAVLMATAEAARPVRRWGGYAPPLAVAALVLLALAPWAWRSSIEPEPTGVGAAGRLMAALTRTTRWQAPSDRWLQSEPPLLYLGLPELARERWRATGRPALPRESTSVIGDRS
jgi:hypothetical protein